MLEAKAKAYRQQGAAEAEVLSLKAEAFQKQGAAEADVLNLKAAAEASGIKEKADAMKVFDAVGKEHEEFKLRLNKDKEIELAMISIQKDIAAQQAAVLGEALKHAKIDIVGGDGQFFEAVRSEGRSRLGNRIASGDDR